MSELSRMLLVLWCCAAHVVLSSASPRPLSLAELETSAPGAIEGDILPDDDLDSKKATSDPSRLWPAANDGTITIPYTFGDSRIDQVKVEEAIQSWRDNTCLLFQPVDGSFNGSHIIFSNSNSYCASKLGRDGTSGQFILLTEGCVESVGPAVHEIAHALGFYHEQSRSDRDQFVTVLLENVQSGAEHNFLSLSTSNHEIPYDYSSVMHYGSRYFTMNDGPTIVPKNPLHLGLLGNRADLSFLDIKLANVVYKCIDQWEDACGSQQIACQNGGFIGKTCSCVCPDGTEGDQCENLVMEYTESVLQRVSPDTETIETPGQISTPGYPTPLQKQTTFVKKIVAPEGYRAKLTMDDLHLFGRGNQWPICYDYLAIYFSGDLELDQLTACGTEISPGSEFFSVGDTLLVEYFNSDFPSSFVSTYRGFLATVSFVLPDINAVRGGALSVHRQKGKCSLEPTATQGTYLLQSPDYPEPYGWFAECVYEISTASPSFLRVTPLEVQLGFLDFLGANFEFYDFQNYGFRKRDAAVVVPTSHVTLEFHSFIFTWGKFNLQVEVLTSDCHKVIEVQKDVTGEIRLPPSYSAGTICEWWLVAPEGEKIQLEIQDDFYIGANKFAFLCTRDYLLIQKNGDRRYDSGEEEFCGSNGPEKISSRKNTMNILFNGRHGGTNNFHAYYYLK